MRVNGETADGDLVTDRSAESSPQLQARIGGFLYLVIMFAGFFSEGYVRGSLVVLGDPAASARNILASEHLYRLGGALEFVTLSCDVTLALVLYNLLKPVSRSLALLAAFFRLVFTSIYAVLSLTHFAPLIILGGASYLNSFSPSQLQTMAYFSLSLHSLGYNISLVFFGIHCVLIGGLITASSFLPRTIGVLLAIAGTCYLINSFASFISPAFAALLFPYILLPGLLAEGSLAIWLFIKGVNVANWQMQTSQVPTTQ
jgi:hypothetical protein